MEIPAGELSGKVRGWLEEAGVRRVTIRDEDGNTILEIPSNAATVRPALAAVDALSGTSSRFRVVVERTGPQARAAVAHPGEDTGAATEDRMNTRNTVAHRIDRYGTSIEDLAGTGEIDTKGG